MSDLQPLSPLNFAPVVGTDFELRALPGIAKVRVQALRKRGMNTPCADTARLPSTPNSVFGADPVMLWKAPDDWLAYSETLSGEQLCQVLREVASSVPLLVTDVSSASVVLELSGAGAIELLMRDCTLDLEGEAVKPGACAQTALAQVSVMLHRPRDKDAWRIFVERSVASHVWSWLTD